MCVVDTAVVSEVRKRGKANPGVSRFANAHANGDALYLSVVTVGASDATLY